MSITCDCGHTFPTKALGLLVRCPSCGRECRQPMFDLGDRDFAVGSVTSGKAIASVALGALFFFACLSGVPAILLGQFALDDIKRGGGRIRGRRLAIAGIALGVVGCLYTLGFFRTAYDSAREDARRMQCTNNLKQLGLAMHYYHDSYDCIPAAAITDGAGKPLLSWRVAILPFIEQQDLFSKFHLDEPWDSPHNRSLIRDMPNVYRCPSDLTLTPGMTGYKVVVGPSTAFTPDFNPLRFLDFTDGLNGTLLIGESNDGVPWTKPEDLPFDMTKALSGLSSHHGNHGKGFNVLFVDGSVRFIKSTIDPAKLSAILTRNGNDVIRIDDY
ncbi:DUF1559 domain-containing protein [Isosphaeraceae bacterium EP7]